MDALKEQYPDVFTGISDDWLDVLWDEQLPSLLTKAITDDVRPPRQHIFEFARVTDLAAIKVVIIGQDPYPKEGEAHGLAFSCRVGIPPSLKNIFTWMVEAGYLSRMPATGSLERWAYEGVLMVNAALTLGQLPLWKPYMERLINRIDHPERDFFLWGNFARGFQVRGRRHEWTHPSPLATARSPFKPDCFGKVDIRWDVLNDPFALFTDGSCYPNNRSPASKGGSAVLVCDGRRHQVYLNANPTPPAASNQRAEGIAIAFALLQVKRLVTQHNLPRGKAFVIYTDSQFWMDMVQKWMPRWSAETFAMKANPDLSQMVWRRWQKVADYVNLVHVPSHNKTGLASGTAFDRFLHDGNDTVDRGASYAREHLQPGPDFIEFEGL